MGTLQPVTFVFITDPQFTSNPDDTSDLKDYRIVNVDAVNKALNSLLDGQTAWPKSTVKDPEGQSPNTDTAMAGQMIDPPKFIVIAGDLTQLGGMYGFSDQAYHNPTNYNGGFELNLVQYFFNPSRPVKSLWTVATDELVDVLTSYTRTKYPRVYFGLGNHDLETGGYPGVLWWDGIGTPADGDKTLFFPDQMWDFTGQMHFGVNTATNPTTDAVYPIGLGSADGNNLSFDRWQQDSMCYMLDFGSFSLVQLHLSGNDNLRGRTNNGQNWLVQQLEKRGKTHPVVIVQHFTYEKLNDVVEDVSWTRAAAEDLLDVIKEYNVIALLCGHIHSPVGVIANRRVWTKPDEPPDYEYNNSKYPDGIPFDVFRPGASGDLGAFAVLRIDANSFTYQQGAVVKPPPPSELSITEASDSAPTIYWGEGFSKPINPHPIWITPVLSDSTSTGSCGNINFCTLPAKIEKATDWVRGLYFAYDSAHQSILPGIIVSDSGGANERCIQPTPNGSDQWAGGGNDQTYVDTRSIVLSPGRRVTGWQLVKQGGNRLQFQLFSCDEDGNDPQQHINPETGSGAADYFPHDRGLRGDWRFDIGKRKLGSSKIVTGFHFADCGDTDGSVGLPTVSFLTLCQDDP